MIPDFSHQRQEKSLVRTLRQVSPDGDSFTQPRTGTVMGATRMPTGNWRCGRVVPRNWQPPLTRLPWPMSWLESFDLWRAFTLPEYSIRMQRILPSDLIRKRVHFRHWRYTAVYRPLID